MNWRDRIAGRVVVASVSGGKDSAAMSLWLMEQGVEYRRVFADTGWEHPDTYAYLRGPLTEALGPIDEVRSEHGGMADLVRGHGMFPSRTRRYCTAELKIQPIAAYISTIGAPVVNAVGLRAEESTKRAAQPEWEPADDIYGADCLVWRPILRMTEDDVVAIHRRHGLTPNPLYLRGARRVGCWPCIASAKAEIRMVADSTPWRIDEIRSLESEVTLRRGVLRAFFDATRGAIDPTASPAQPIPIDEVVGWSRTARGGKQFSLFGADQTESGCVRWGLCETAREESHHE
jgi:3'-phosphoadenosine 5'-phosphosulfate sulfotransferase (PAPS reductase)/FAD synthetase